jgi:ABC-type lipoprotein release transport system permease subunit
MFNVIVKMAFLNVWRKKSRSLLVVLMIGFSLSGLIFVQGLYDGMMVQMINNATRSDSGDMSVYQKNYRLSKANSDVLIKPEITLSTIQKTSGVKSAVSRLHIEGLIASANYSQGANIIGVDLINEQKHARLNEYLIEGEYGFGKKERGVILGAELAKKLKITVGKKVILSSQDINHEISSLAFRVKGILRANNSVIDKYAVYISLPKANALIATKNSVTQIAIMLEHKDQMQTIWKQLTKNLDKENQLYSWKELYPTLLTMQEMTDAFNAVSYLIVFLVAAIGIFGVILFSVLERLREFGVMMAIGTPFREVAKMLIIESLLLAFLGFAFGVLLSGSALAYYSQVGIDLKMYSDAFAQFGMSSLMIPSFKVAFFSDAFFAVMIATLLAIIFPLRRLKKLSPIDAINEH